MAAATPGKPRVNRAAPARTTAAMAPGEVPRRRRRNACPFHGDGTAMAHLAAEAHVSAYSGHSRPNGALDRGRWEGSNGPSNRAARMGSSVPPVTWGTLVRVGSQCLLHQSFSLPLSP